MIPPTLRFDINLSIIFTELPLGRRPAAAASAGFTAVEFWWPFAQAVPSSRAVDEFVCSIEDAGVTLVALNLFAGDMPAGERGVISVPGRQRELSDSLDVLVSIATRTGCRLFNALYGHRVDDAAPGAQDELAAQNLAMAAQAVAPFGGSLLLEPLTLGENGPYPLLHATQVLSVIDRVQRDCGISNVRMLADLYHLTRNGDDLDSVLTMDLPRVGHVQIADIPGRHEPGTGTLDFARAFRLLARGGYAGYVGLEYRPTGPSADSFGWLRQARHGDPRASGNQEGPHSGYG